MDINSGDVHVILRVHTEQQYSLGMSFRTLLMAINGRHFFP